MTESEWSECLDGGLMFHWLLASGKASDRKLRLFACAWCRTLEEVLVEEGLRAVEVSERYADGSADDAEVRAVREAAKQPRMSVPGKTSWYLRGPDAQAALQAAVMVAWGRQDSRRCVQPAFEQVLRARRCVRSRQPRIDAASILRDLLGPLPFRPMSIDPAWLSWNGGLVGRLAGSAYEGRTYEELPVLADALEEAGCDIADLLGHLRGPGPHCRGCFALDSLLGRD